jgi:hypothetical protein
MAAQQRAFRNAKRIAGAALAVFGMFPIYENAAGALARFSDGLGNGSRALGTFPAFVLAVSQAVHTYSFCHQQLLQGLFQQLLLSCWPLVLIIVGAALSTDGFTEKSDARPRE